MFFSDFDSTQFKAPVIGKAPAPILGAIRKRTRRFLKDSIEGEDLLVVPKLLSKRSRNQQVLTPRCTSTKEKTTSRRSNEDWDEDDDQTNVEEHFDD